MEASTLEMDEDVVEGSQFSPSFGTERQYLDWNLQLLWQKFRSTRGNR